MHRFFLVDSSIQVLLLLVYPCLQRLKPRSDQEENELVILHLRQLCETKQKSHIHIGEAAQVNSVR